MNVPVNYFTDVDSSRKESFNIKKWNEIIIIIIFLEQEYKNYVKIYMFYNILIIYI